MITVILLCVALVATAAFVVVKVRQYMTTPRIDPQDDPLQSDNNTPRTGTTSGVTLKRETVLDVPIDLKSISRFSVLLKILPYEGDMDVCSMTTTSGYTFKVKITQANKIRIVVHDPRDIETAEHISTNRVDRDSVNVVRFAITILEHTPGIRIGLDVNKLQNVNVVELPIEKVVTFRPTLRFSNFEGKVLALKVNGQNIKLD